MNQKDFLKRLKELHDECVEISTAKNADYASEGDAFKNFKSCEAFGIESNVGIIVRMTDKLMRASNLLHQEAKVKDEKIADTLKDLANYALILAIKIEADGKG